MQEISEDKVDQLISELSNFNKNFEQLVTIIGNMANWLVNDYAPYHKK